MIGNFLIKVGLGTAIFTIAAIFGGIFYLFVRQVFGLPGWLGFIPVILMVLGLLAFIRRNS